MHSQLTALLAKAEECTKISKNGGKTLHVTTVMYGSVGVKVQGHGKEQLTQTLIVRLLKTHLFLLLRKLGGPRTPQSAHPGKRIELVVRPAAAAEWV